MERTEGRLSQLEDRVIEITQYEQKSLKTRKREREKKEKREGAKEGGMKGGRKKEGKKENKHRLKNHGTIQNLIFVSLESQRKGETGRSLKKKKLKRKNNNSWKLPKLDKNSKQDKPKEIQAETS